MILNLYFWRFIIFHPNRDGRESVFVCIHTHDNGTYIETSVVE